MNAISKALQAAAAALRIRVGHIAPTVDDTHRRAAVALVPLLYHAHEHIGAWWAQAAEAGAEHEALQLQIAGAATEAMADFLAAMVAGDRKAASAVLKGLLETAIEADVVRV